MKYSDDQRLKKIYENASKLNQYIVEKDYINEKSISLYGTKIARIPKPELYLIYTGKRGRKPAILSFQDEFFGGEETAVEVKAKVIYGDSKKKDVISQYIEYCHVLDMQVKKYG